MHLYMHIKLKWLIIKIVHVLFLKIIAKKCNTLTKVKAIHPTSPSLNPPPPLIKPKFSFLSGC